MLIIRLEHHKLQKSFKIFTNIKKNRYLCNANAQTIIN